MKLDFSSMALRKIKIIYHVRIYNQVVIIIYDVESNFIEKNGCAKV